MDRKTIYQGQIPLETDLLDAQQFAMIGLAKFTEAVLGTGPYCDGLTVAPTSPAGLNVNLGPGTIYQIENLEATVWSSVAADTSHSIVKQGILLNTVTLGITPPGTLGYSQVFLVEVQYEDFDTGSVVLPYYNAANPSVPFSGPSNNGSAQNTVRQGKVAYQIKAGVAATTGTQTAPTADAGWTGLYTITVANGATTITAGNITQLASAPFIDPKLPAVPAGVQEGKWIYGQDTGTANTVVATLSPVPTILLPGMTVRVKIANSNTGAMTFNPNGIGASPIVKANGAAMSSGDVLTGMILELSWSGSNWQCLNYLGIQSSSSTVNNTYNVDVPYGQDTGTADHIVVTLNPAISSWTVGQIARIKLANTITGPTTITANGLAAINLVTVDEGSSLSWGDAISGQIIVVQYDGSSLQLLNPYRHQTSGLAGQRSTCTGSSPGNVKTASWSIAEFIVETTYGGVAWKGQSLSPLNFNGATVGAGGMDVGTMPVSADISIYVIFNPATNTWSTLGCIGTTSNGYVYTGSALPAGYVASGLLYSGKTDASGNLVAFNQIDRKIVTVPVQIFNFATGGGAAAYVSQSISVAVPQNAKTCTGWLFAGSIGSSGTVPQVASTADGKGSVMGSGSAGFISNYQPTTIFSELPLVSPQNLWWQTGSADTGTATNMYISEYTF